MMVSDLLLGWMHDDGYSLGESGWMNPLTGKRWWQVEATKDGLGGTIGRDRSRTAVAWIRWAAFGRFVDARSLSPKGELLDRP